MPGPYPGVCVSGRLVIVLAMLLLSIPVAQAQDPLPPILPPQALTAVMDGANTILEWEPSPTGNVSAYNVYRGGLLVATVDGATMVFVDTSPNGNSYFVTATDGQVESVPSNMVNPRGSCIDGQQPFVSPETCVEVAIALAFWVLGEITPTEATKQPEFVVVRVSPI